METHFWNNLKYKQHQDCLKIRNALWDAMVLEWLAPEHAMILVQMQFSYQRVADLLQDEIQMEWANKMSAVVEYE